MQLECSHVASSKISKNKYAQLFNHGPTAWANKASYIKCEPNLEISFENSSLAFN